MQDQNRALILRLIRVHQPISRTDLVRQTGLTKGTISNIVSALIEANLVREIQHGNSTGGRRPTLLKLATEYHIIGAIDIRPRLTTLTVATLDGHFIQRTVILTDAYRPRVFLEQCVGQVSNMLKQFKTRTILGVGIVIPGYVDPEAQAIREVPILNWKNIDLSAIQAQFDFPIHVSNDAHAVALAEQIFGNKPGADTFAHILVQSDGIRAGFVQDGKLYEGRRRQAGNLANTVIDLKGELCPSGRQGCVGLYASGEGIARRYQMHIQRQHALSQANQSIHGLTATSTMEGVRLNWTNQESGASQYAVFRSPSLPVPTDAVHCVGFTGEQEFLDYGEYKEDGYYTVCIVEADGRQGPPATAVMSSPEPQETLFEDSLTTLNPFEIHADVLPQVSKDGLITGNANREDHETRLWREDLRAGIITGVVRPVKSGPYDTCGVLFKYESSNKWYCATLAYGPNLVSRNTLALMRHNGSTADEWLGFYELDIQENVDYVIKVLLDGGWIRVKAWREDGIEPSDWQIVLRDDTEWTGGGVGFRCYGHQALLKRLSVRSSPEKTNNRQKPAVPYDYSDTTLRLLEQHAHEGNSLAQRLLQDAGHAIGVSIDNMASLFEINHFYVSGYLLEAPLPWLQEALREKTAEGLTITAGSLGPEASLLGAVAVASKSVFDV